MKFIPLGLGCIIPEALKRASLREYSYPFDWLWSPSKTTYSILQILLTQGIDSAVEYMTNGYSYYEYLGNEHYNSCENVTENQMNKNTGIGITHFTINDEYKAKLKIRFERLLRDIQSQDRIAFLYSDSTNSEFNYYLDEVEYGVDGYEYLLKIYELILPINPNIEFYYFCWRNRVRESNDIIKFIPYDYYYCWLDISELAKNYLIEHVVNKVDR
jgi:hypothetical protein